MKRFYLIFSAIFFFLGIFFIINDNANITGAAIGFESPLNSLLGITFLLSSFLLFVAGIKEASLKYADDLRNISKDSIIILDASIIKDNEESIESILQEHQGKVFVPKAVLNEISPETKEKLKNALFVEGYALEKYKKMARKQLAPEEITEADVEVLATALYLGERL